jgi:hypothetical protein
VYYADTRQDPARVQVQQAPAEPVGTHTVQITSAAAIDEPMVTVYLQIGCGQKVSRRFVMLADYPNVPETSDSLARVADAVATSTPVDTPALVVANTSAASTVSPTSPADATTATRTDRSNTPSAPDAATPATRKAPRARPDPQGTPSARGGKPPNRSPINLRCTNRLLRRPPRPKRSVHDSNSTRWKTCRNASKPWKPPPPSSRWRTWCAMHSALRSCKTTLKNCWNKRPKTKPHWPKCAHAWNRPRPIGFPPRWCMPWRPWCWPVWRLLPCCGTGDRWCTTAGRTRNKMMMTHPRQPHAPLQRHRPLQRWPRRCLPSLQPSA